MPLEMLQALADTPLPVTVTAAADINKLRVLRAAGQVAAMLPKPGSAETFARLLTITPEGHAALAKLRGVPRAAPAPLSSAKLGQ